MSSNAYDFYVTVINEVVDRMKDEFINEGVSEDVLQKLREIWVEKLKAKNVDAHGPRMQDIQQNSGNNSNNPLLLRQQNPNPMMQQNYPYPNFPE